MNERRRALRSLAGLGLATPLSALAAPLAAAPDQGRAELAALQQKINGHAQLPPTFNPLAGNPLRTRADVVRGIKDLYLPLTPYYSQGGARVRLDPSATIFDQAAVDLEGFARPLWGLAPLAAGGGADFVDWDLLRRGLANGTDPEHPEYWEACADRDQRMVELAAVGFALRLIPHLLWQPQSARAKKNIAAYLQNAYGRSFISNNWMFFRLMIGLGLRAVGEPVDVALMAQYEQALGAFYLGQGWYQDGAFPRADHYVAFAFNFYGALYSRLGAGLPGAQRCGQRAAELAPHFAHWFADDGAVIPFGRSLTYRFACAAYWSAQALTETPAMGWGELKGMILRHLRWWSRQPIAHRDGVLSLGFAYPNQQATETYSSAGSPYWAFKVFAFMALPEQHPFWTTPEQALPAERGPATLPQPGMLLFHPAGDAIALCSGQEEIKSWLRMGAEKYAKFAYSAHYGFNVETVANQYESASFDNMLGFSRDGVHFRVREGNQVAMIADQLLYARWSPDEDITVETWLLPASPWHIRLHRIRSAVSCHVTEGGFAIERRPHGQAQQGEGSACLVTDQDLSGIRDLGSSVARSGRVLEAVPNSNLINPRSSVPQLRATLAPGVTLLLTAVLAQRDPPAGRLAWERPPAAPAIEALERIIRDSGVAVGTMRR